MTHSLTLGALLLTDSFSDADHDFKFDVLAEGVGFGVASGVKEVVTSLLADGDLTRTTRYGNREVSFVVEITGPDLASLAHGEAALRREVGRANTLTWQPPDEFAVATVFEVVDSEMAQRFDDLDELGKRRKFTLTLTCAAFARSQNPVTVEALGPPPVTPTIVTINDATSTTGWTATLASWSTGVTTPTIVDLGADGVSASGNGWSLDLRYTPSSPVALTGTPYLTVDLAGTAPTAFYVSYSDGSGSKVVPVLARSNPSGSVTYVLPVVAAKSLSALTVTHENLVGSGGIDGYLSFSAYDISRTDTLPQIGVRQITRIVEVGGTERTPGSIHVQTADGTGSLGLTIVHTSPEDGSGYSPPLRRWRVGASTGPEATDAAALSGKTEPVGFFGGGFYAEVPTSAIPEGGYVLVARMRSLAVQTKNLYWSASTIFPDATTQEGYVSGSLPYSFPDTNWHLIPLAALSLPSVRTSAGKVQILLQAESGGAAQVELDEGWLFRADDDCALTILETTRPHLWLDSADQSSPVPRVWVGDGAATKVHPGSGLLAQGSHVLSPDGTALFTAALTDNPAADATFYRRWPSNAAN